MALIGVSDEQIKEAGWTAQSVTGSSAYVHSVDYGVERFNKELDKIVEHIKTS